MNAKTKKSTGRKGLTILKPATRKAAKIDPTKKVKPFEQLAIVQNDEKMRRAAKKAMREPSTRKERALSRKEQEEKELTIARMVLSMNTPGGYDPKPKQIVPDNDLEGIAPMRKRGGKKTKAATRNQRGLAAERKAARKAEREAAREAKKAERERAKQLRNVPALDFTPAMVKEVMAEYENQLDTPLRERRKERLTNQAKRLSTFPIGSLSRRIKNMQNRIKLMEAVLTIGKAAVDDGYKKYLPAKVRKGRKGRVGFGKKAADTSAKPAPKKAPAKKAK